MVAAIFGFQAPKLCPEGCKALIKARLPICDRRILALVCLSREKKKEGETIESLDYSTQ